MKHTICRTYRFEAAHHLPLLPKDHKCHRLHGHNYRMDVELTGELDAGGMVIEFSFPDLVVNTLLYLVDHRLLNDVIPNPTAENIAAWMWDSLQSTAVGDKLKRVRVYENDDSWAQIE